MAQGEPCGITGPIKSLPNFSSLQSYTNLTVKSHQDEYSYLNLYFFLLLKIQLVNELPETRGGG